jgi:4-amino-4-deoxy-L-arabinose transferase-like glycosyltransferase
MLLDASRYFLQAKHLALYGLVSFLGQWGEGIQAWTDLPLMPALYGLLFRYLGEARVYVQALNTGLFALTVVLVFELGRLLWDTRTGFYGAVFLLGIPYLYTQVPLMMVDVGAMFFLMLALWCALKALRQGGRWLPAAALAAALALLTKFTLWGLLPLGLLGLSLAVGRPCRALAVLALAGLLLAPLGLYKAEVLLAQLRLLVQYQLPALKGWNEGYASVLLFQSHPLLLAFSLWGLGQAVRLRDRGFVLPGLLLLLALAIGAPRMRYLLPVLPLLALAAGYGLRGLRLPGAFLCMAVAGTAFALAASAYLPFLKGTSMGNLREAARLLEALPAERVLVKTLPQQASLGSTWALVPILDLYSSKEILSRAPSPPEAWSKALRLHPLRFSWELRAPDFYRPAGSPQALVLLSGSDRHHPPEGLTRAGAFTAHGRAFRYKAFAAVYVPLGPEKTIPTPALSHLGQAAASSGEKSMAWSLH